MKKKAAQYAKAIVAVTGLAASMATAFGLTQYPYVSLAIAVLTALGVVRVPNAPLPGVLPEK